MSCHKLIGTRILSCTANRFVYVPSLNELTEYCFTSRHGSCPQLKHAKPEKEIGHTSQVAIRPQEAVHPRENDHAGKDAA